MSAQILDQTDTSSFLALNDYACNAVAGQLSEQDREWSLIVDDLLRIRNLENDWDGDGGVAPSSELVDFALWLTRKMKDHQPDFVPSAVFAGPNGTVIFEWRYGLTYYEVEVCGVCHVECLLRIPGQASKFRVIRVD